MKIERILSTLLLDLVLAGLVPAEGRQRQALLVQHLQELRPFSALLHVLVACGLRSFA